MDTGQGSRNLERYAWFGGLLYVVALLGEAVISAGYKLSQDDSASKIAQSLADHRKSLIVVFSLSAFFTPSASWSGSRGSTTSSGARTANDGSSRRGC